MFSCLRARSRRWLRRANQLSTRTRLHQRNRSVRREKKEKRGKEGEGESGRAKGGRRKCLTRINVTGTISTCQRVPFGTPCTSDFDCEFYTQVQRARQAEAEGERRERREKRNCFCIRLYFFSLILAMFVRGTR